MYNWTCKSYIVKKNHRNTGDNRQKQNALCMFVICIWKLIFSSSVILTVFCFNNFALCPNIDRKFKVFSLKKYNFNTKCSCLP